MKNRRWHRDRWCLTGFILSYFYWLQASWTLRAETFTSVGQKKKKWSTSLVTCDCHTWGQVVKLCRGSTGWRDDDETRRRMTTHLRIHWSCTHTDWTADEESSEYWRSLSSVGGHEVLWPRETPGSPWGLRTTTLQMFTVMKIYIFTFSSRVDTNRAAEHHRSE